MNNLNLFITRAKSRCPIRIPLSRTHPEIFQKRFKRSDMTSPEIPPRLLNMKPIQTTTLPSSNASNLTIETFALPSNHHIFAIHNWIPYNEALELRTILSKTCEKDLMKHGNRRHSLYFDVCDTLNKETYGTAFFFSFFFETHREKNAMKKVQFRCENFEMFSDILRAIHTFSARKNN